MQNILKKLIIKTKIVTGNAFISCGKKILFKAARKKEERGRQKVRKINKIKTRINKYDPTELYDYKEDEYILPKNFTPHCGSDPVGLWQLRFLTENGLLDTHRFLDIGCGDLRLGANAIQYLEPGCFLGIDQSRTALYQGFQSLTSIHWDQKPRFYVGGAFELDVIGQELDFVWAHSVFSHIDFSLICKCLYSVKQVLHVDGVFAFSLFLMEEEKDWGVPKLYREQSKSDEKYIYSYRNPFMHSEKLIRLAVHEIGYETFDLIGVTPKGQSIIRVGIKDG